VTVDLDAIIARIGQDDERRMVLMPVELRAEGDEGTVLEGYGATFNQWAQIGPSSWGFMERIAPGAFAETIREDDIRSFFNHDSNHVLGRNTTKTLQLSEDEKGLRTVIRPPDTAAARDVVTLIKRGDVSGMSFMFRVRKDQWDDPDGEDGMPKRTLLDVKLIEVGPVSLPAYPQTSIGARDKSSALIEALTARARAVTQNEDAGRVAVADADRARRLRFAQAGL
jgi:HK97 family phage prohead protease